MKANIQETHSLSLSGDWEGFYTYRNGPDSGMEYHNPWHGKKGVIEGKVDRFTGKRALSIIERYTL